MKISLRRKWPDVRGQARFLRAYFYWLLLRKFGPIPILPPEGADYTKSYDELAYPRKTYDECVSFITSELEIAATELFEKRDNLNIARPTKGAALLYVPKFSFMLPVRW